MMNNVKRRDKEIDGAGILIQREMRREEQGMVLDGLGEKIQVGNGIKLSYHIQGYSIQ